MSFAEFERIKRIRALDDETLAAHIRAVRRDRANGYPSDYGQEYLDEMNRREMTLPTPESP